MTETLNLNFDDLTLGDLEYLEEEFEGRATELLQNWDKQGAKFMTAVIWRLLLHHNPDATIEDARDVKVMELGGDAAPPTKKPANRAQRRAGGKPKG